MKSWEFSLIMTAATWLIFVTVPTALNGVVFGLWLATLAYYTGAI